jgi:cytidine deaminase
MQENDESERIWEDLLGAARNAAGNAYAPYSSVHVGAALRDEHGAVHPGCNVENASFGLTICAERNALFAAVAGAGRVGFTHLAIFSDAEKPMLPCGACLQVLREFSQDLPILSVNVEGERLRSNLRELLPCPFRLEPPASEERRGDEDTVFGPR